MSVYGNFIFYIWSIVETEFVHSKETVAICITILNILGNVVAQFILEIENVFICERIYNV